MIVVIGSENPVKVKAATRAFSDRLGKGITFKQAQVSSGVPDQPFGDDTQTGARNRAIHARETCDADFGVGLEGGIAKHQERWFSHAWCAIAAKDGDIHYGHSFGIELPSILVTKIIDEKKELGTALDELLQKENTKHKEGFFGFATDNIVTRETGYYEMICAALAPVVLKQYYSQTP